MSPETDRYVVFTFRASHHAFWAEELAGERSIPAELVPAPSEADSKCGLGLRAPERRASDLEAVFEAEAIGFDRWNESES